MLLHDLLRQFDPSLSLTGISDALVGAVREDSRLVRPDDLFIARPAIARDGSRSVDDLPRYIADAAARGAIAIVTGAKLPGVPIPQIVVRHPASAVSILSHLHQGQPTDKVKTLAVTGTNGKTTTTYLVRHLINHLKQRCGLVGTVEIDDGRTRRPATMTTPSAGDLAELFAGMRDKGCWRCAIEVSSHALDQDRVAGMRFAAAGFTNLTGDHFDYHHTMESYATAKAKLFQSLDESAVAVMNADDRWSGFMQLNCKARIIRFGFGKSADYQARDIAITSQGSNFILVTPDGRAEVKMGLIGKYNIENALLAAAMVGETFGCSVHQLAAGLKDAQGAPGRLQAVRAGQPFSVLVDYAHTDDALKNVLSTLRPLARGKLRVLFGCGGDRDTTKRPRMAEVAEKFADAIYLTSDNPRHENPEAILDQVEAGFSRKLDKPIVRESDRHAAIARILGDGEAGDVVLLAGKGHENYQIIGAESRHFDDVEEANRVLQMRFAAA